MKTTKPDTAIQFLQGGGELGLLTRVKDWSKTTLGDPGSWPQSLQTTISILLNSRFPMFLWWGPELICFYNDAYRPSLGENGKHPVILGMKAEEAWSEIWDIIKPLIDQVLSGGESVWSENQLIPIFRNGKIEDVYWTFSYSPVKGESGEVAGVLVICNETTQAITTFNALEESKRELEFAIDATALGTWDYNPLTNQFSSNERLKSWFGFPNDVQLKLTDAIDVMLESDRSRITSAIEKALDFSSGGTYDVEYTIVHPVSKEKKNVRAKGRAWFNDQKIAYRFNGTLEDITEKTTAVKMTAQTESNIRNMVLQAPIGIAVLDANSLVIDIANRSFVEVTGKAYEDIAGKFYWDTFAEARPYFEDALKKVVKDGVPYFADEVEMMLLRHGKPENVFLTFVYSPLRNSEGHVDKVAVWLLESTQQVLARRELQRNTDKLNIVIDASELGTFELDLKTDVVECSERFYQIFGYVNGERLNHTEFLNHLHPDDVDIRAAAFKDAQNDGYLQYQSRVITRDKSVKWIEVKGQVYYDKQKTPSVLIGTCRDITPEKKHIQEQQSFAEELERKVRERTQELVALSESLRESETRYHLMVEEVQDYAILYINKEGIVENWNAGAEKIKGYIANEIIGKNFSSFYTEDDRANQLPQKLLELATRTGRAAQEGWRVRKDGRLFWASVVITAVHDEKKDVIGFSKVTHDLSEKRDAENRLKKNAAELRQKNADLEKMNKELQSFAYISSHDLQEPLRKIQTFSSRIREKEYENLTPYGKDYLQRMQNAAERMQTLIDDLLAYSRTNNAERKFENTDLQKIVDEVKSDVREELQQRDARIETCELGELRIIPFQFRQLLLNLVSNSIKFADAKRPLVIKIESKTALGSEFDNDKILEKITYCRIRVADNGIGFEPQFNEKIFDLFQRLHGKETYNGTGIGLAIVKKIAENHDGMVFASGQLNKGATFDIFLPVK